MCPINIARCPMDGVPRKRHSFLFPLGHTVTEGGRNCGGHGDALRVTFIIFIIISRVGSQHGVGLRKI